MSAPETTASSPPQEHKKIFLAAVDESEESIHALSWFVNKILPASSSGHHHRSTLVLVYVKPPPPLYFSPDGHVFSADVMAAMDKYRNDVAECVMVKAKRVCKQAAGDNDNGDYQVKVETMIENGDARDVICQVAEKLGVDVLVMGSHGYGPIKRAFLGSVSNHCAQNVKCPILIIKRPKSNN
ncbi:unnamed protein product [Linum tenue]|uniref:UspA domain-containing protein n=1 Tax=Linum tenue TaxID=586396 RepID=A0AAV0NZJ8_9ROSI|nr:unnamed protein product [Linum tenue]